MGTTPKLRSGTLEAPNNPPPTPYPDSISSVFEVLKFGTFSLHPLKIFHNLAKIHLLFIARFHFFPYLCSRTMVARREKAKSHNQLNQQLAAQEEQKRVMEKETQKKKSRREMAKKLGDFFVDVAKLIVGGVVLGGLMKQDIEFLK